MKPPTPPRIYHQDATSTIIHGDCRHAMPELLGPESIDACVTDPPYNLTSIVQRFGKDGAAPAQPNGMQGAYARLSRGFMGQEWDGTGVAFDPATWREVWRVLKPGAHLVAFGGTRTYHRMTCAVEDAGFEIRDCLAWLYGSGFPKSHNLDGDWDGWGTALKPAFEPIILARKPLAAKSVAANVRECGTGAVNVDGCRLATDWATDPARRGWQGGNSKTVGVTGNFGHVGPRISTPNAQGRWPANVILDEEAAALLDAQSGVLHHQDPATRQSNRATGGRLFDLPGMSACYADRGGASRFFYTAKASKSERQGVTHPTVKPVALMRWLVRLVTPPGGEVLDCFAGTGTTRLAALAEGFRCVLIEQDATYLEQMGRRTAQTGLSLEFVE